MLEIVRPTLIVDEDKCREHIHQMHQKSIASGVSFRPHFKTHQSQAIGRWYREAGVTKITTSSLAMAEYFAADGWDDITVAFPLNYLEHKLINSLAGKINLNLCAVSPESVELLSEKLTHSVNLFIEIDTGYGRTGINSEDHTSVGALIEVIEKEEKMSFAGFISHAGHSYKCRSRIEIENIHRESIEKARSLVNRVRPTYPTLVCSIGDTPTCSVSESFHGADEIRPGNFIFYDVTQTAIGSCSINDVAIVVACPIVAMHPAKNEIIVHGGAVHLSKDSIVIKSGRQIFGRLAIVSESGWNILAEDFYVKSISQEHGILSVPSNAFSSFKIGERIGILPVHSCLTADCMGGYTTLSGEVLDHFKGAPK